jgi:SAM-dependent methyltransferase
MDSKPTPGSTSRLTHVDHRETYGRHILAKLAPSLDLSLCVDLGCGEGRDLSIVKAAKPGCTCVGVDFGGGYRETIIAKGIEFVDLDIESEPLPFEDSSVDLIVANQVLEHTKEIFWINHEVFRTLRVGGHLLLGVPNVLSPHPLGRVNWTP